MLKKLFVHEWRSFWKVPAAMCLFALVYAFIGALTFQTDLWNNDYRLVRLVLVFGSIGYFILLIAPAIILSIYTALRFYRNLFTDEGYLMHTLPVKKWELNYHDYYASLGFTCDSAYFHEQPVRWCYLG